jgi:crossover junction endodeoxyribonuclease RuvC
LIVLGIDPGSHNTGYAFLERTPQRVRVLEYGVSKPPKTASVYDRIGFIIQDLEPLFGVYKPQYMGMERSFVGTNANTALVLGQARGAVQALAWKCGSCFCEYSPTEIKKRVTGRGQASKEQVAGMMQMLLSLKNPPEPLDASDALAIAWLTLIDH